MKSVNFTEEIQIVVEACINCGVPFGLEGKYRKDLLRTGKTFYCPNGHPQVFSNSLETQLKQARENAQWWKNEAEEKARSLSATRGVLTRTKNRIAKGICPCCHRQFISVAEHMKKQHPSYLTEEDKEE
jgi:hypothetical protein